MIFAAISVPFLSEITLFLIICAIVAYGCHHVGLAPITGFLLTGVLIGPHTTGIVADTHLVEMLAEVGVILLLFEIGLEFSLTELRRLQGTVLLGGGGQTVITIALVGGLLLALNVDPASSFFTGCLVALSSTAVVLGLLADWDQTETPHGQLSLSILIFQDLAIIPLVLIIPILGGGGGSLLDISSALGIAVLVLAGTLILAWIVVPHILGAIAKTRRPELFVITVIAIALGTAWAVSMAGVSLALGAFLAGLVVSESQYKEQALADILPFRTIFTSFFFVSVGMLLDPMFLVERPLLVLGTIGAVLILKTAITTGTVLGLGYPTRIAVLSGVGLAQIGEFSFVLQRAGQLAGLTPAGLGVAGEQTFIASAVLLMTATPLLFTGGERLGKWIQDMVAPNTKTEEDDAEDEGPHLEDHVVIVGFGPAGRHLSQVLTEFQLPFSVIDLNPSSVEEAREDGIEAIYGDATRSPILKEAGIMHAKLCVVVVNDREAALRITRLARHQNPTLHIVTRTRFLNDMDTYQEAGADVVVPEEMETTVRIFSHVLSSYLIPSSEIRRHVEELRRDDYQFARKDLKEAHRLVLEGLDEEGLHTRAVLVRAGAPVEGRTLQEINLRRDHSLTVLAIRRNSHTYTTPAGDFRLESGDRVVLVGTADQFARTAHLFRTPDPQL